MNQVAVRLCDGQDCQQNQKNNGKSYNCGKQRDHEYAQLQQCHAPSLLNHGLYLRSDARALVPFPDFDRSINNFATLEQKAKFKSQNYLGALSTQVSGRGSVTMAI